MTNTRINDLSVSPFIDSFLREKENDSPGVNAYYVIVYIILFSVESAGHSPHLTIEKYLNVLNTVSRCIIQFLCISHFAQL